MNDCRAYYKGQEVACYYQYHIYGVCWYWIPGIGTVPEIELKFI